MAQARVEENRWLCPLCDYQNNESSMRCALCTSGNPSAFGKESEDSVTQLMGGLQVNNAPNVRCDWICPSCSYQESGTVCMNCNRPEGNNWTRPVCSVTKGCALACDCNPRQDVPCPQVARSFVNSQESHPPMAQTSTPGERRKTQLDKHLRKKIVGQDDAISSVADAIERREAGWMRDEKPLVMLFLGTSGIGKTAMAKEVSNYLAKQGRRGFIRVDMSEYQESHHSQKFIGSPPGYKNHEEGGQLTESLKKTPKAVVLFDEVEKAHAEVLTVLLQLFDEGRLTDSKGETVVCEKATFIMTSNLASDKITTYWQRKKDEPTKGQIKLSDSFKEEIVQPELKKHFKRDEFLGRINEIVYFVPFCNADLVKLVEKEMSCWRKKAKSNHNIALTWEEAVLQVLARTFNVRFGARSIQNGVEKRIVNQLYAVTRHEIIPKGSEIHISVVSDDRAGQSSDGEVDSDTDDDDAITHAKLKMELRDRYKRTVKAWQF